MNNFEYFTKNQAELYQDYPDKYLVIKDCKVEGDFCLLYTSDAADD